MEKSTIALTISLVMVTLFTIAIIGFSINFASDNDSVVDITQDPELSALSTQTTSGISTFKDEAEGTYTSIIDTTIEPGSDVAQSTGPFAITPGNVMGVTKNIIYLPYKKIFGGDVNYTFTEINPEGDNGFKIFFTTFTAFLIFISGLLIYKTLRGNP